MEDWYKEAIDRRIVAIWIGIYSLSVLGTYLLILIVREDLFLPLASEEQILWIKIALGILALIPILEILAAFMKRHWLFVPYIVFFSIFALAQTAFLVYILVDHFDQLTSVSSAALFFLNTFVTLTTFWSVATITGYFLALKRSQGHAYVQDEDGVPLFDDSERDHALKPTIVSKLLNDYDYSRRGSQ